MASTAWPQVRARTHATRYQPHLVVVTVPHGGSDVGFRVRIVHPAVEQTNLAHVEHAQFLGELKAITRIKTHLNQHKNPRNNAARAHTLTSSPRDSCGSMPSASSTSTSAAAPRALTSELTRHKAGGAGQRRRGHTCYSRQCVLRQEPANRRWRCARLILEFGCSCAARGCWRWPTAGKGRSNSEAQQNVT